MENLIPAESDDVSDLEDQLIELELHPINNNSENIESEDNNEDDNQVNNDDRVPQPVPEVTKP